MRMLVNWVCLCPLLLTCAAGCGSGALAKGSAGAMKPPPAPIRVGQAIQKTVARKLTVIGNVRPLRTSVVASGNSGIVEKFLVREGQFVKEGETLSVLRMTTTDLEIEENVAILAEREQALKELKEGYRKQDIEEAEAKLRAYDAARKSSMAKLQRVQELKARGAATQEELDDAEERAVAAVNIFTAQERLVSKWREGYRPTEIAQAQARFEAQKKHVAFLEAEKEKRTTFAPFNGYVVQEHTHEGQFLSLGSPIVTLTALDQVDVVVPVDEQDIGMIQFGQTVTLSIQSQSDETFEGTVNYIVPQSEWQKGSRAFPVKVQLKNRFRESPGMQPEPVLKEGMTAQVTFQGPPQDAVLVPKDAIVRGATGTIVYLFLQKGEAGQGQVQPVPIQEGISDGTWIQDASGGIKAGMQVVIEGAERLRPYQDVQIIAEKPLDAQDSKGATPAPKTDKK